MLCSPDAHTDADAQTRLGAAEMEKQDTTVRTIAHTLHRVGAHTNSHTLALGALVGAAARGSGARKHCFDSNLNFRYELLVTAYWLLSRVPRGSCPTGL